MVISIFSINFSGMLNVGSNIVGRLFKKKDYNNIFKKEIIFKKIENDPK